MSYNVPGFTPDYLQKELYLICSSQSILIPSETVKVLPSFKTVF